MSDAKVFDVVLTGCRPEPLASYLKALGVLRVIAEQRDASACGWWQGEHFVLRSQLDREALLAFFLDDWCPTPVISPWNGGSGFFPKDNRAASDAILASADPRFAPFATALRIAREFIAAQGWTERPADDAKILLIASMRATLPDEALAWLDAAIILGDERLMFPPLLGTGGNDGRLDFSNNFQQRVVEVVESRAPAALASALFATPITSRFEGTMGQYSPAANKRTNPWDFVLLMEGAMLFAAAATRRYESASPAVLAFPFHARAAGGLGTVVESDENASRDELWLPLWGSPATLRAIRRLFAEGRATVGAGERAHAAATALDFARAVTALGVDRGIDRFTRIGFHVRNGLSYYATPLGRFETGEIRAARLLDDVDAWFDRFRHKASAKNTPARIALARRRLELAMFEAVTTGNVGAVLVALGAAEQALARSLGFTNKAFLSPAPRLPSTWAAAVADGSIEHRLASALAARPGMRSRLVPLERSGRAFGRADDLACVFSERPLVDNLHALLHREDIEGQKMNGEVSALAPLVRCSLSDIAQFIEGTTDDTLIESWLRGLVLIEGLPATRPVDEPLMPPAAFSILALAHQRRVGDLAIPRTPGLLSAACAGDAITSTTRAIRRLHACGRSAPVAALVEPIARMRRIAAALAFPLTRGQLGALEAMVFPAAISPAAEFADSSQEQA